MSTQPIAHRPIGVSLLAAVQGLGSILSIAGGAAGIALASRAPALLGPLQPFAPAAGAALLVAGGLSLAVSAGLWRGLGWAWIAALLAESLHGLGDVGTIVARGLAPDKVISLAVAAALVYYFTRPRVRAYFGRAARA